MQHLETILQEMVVRKTGKKGWMMVVQRCLAYHDFEQHLESYGAQRVSPVNRGPRPRESDLSSGFLLLIFAAETLGTGVSDLLEDVGEHYASSLPIPGGLGAPFASSAGFFSALAFFHTSCTWIYEILTPGSLRLTTAGNGCLKIRCSTREKDFWAFVKGFISEIHRRLEGDPDATCSDGGGQKDGNALSFILSSPPKSPGHRTGGFPLLLLQREAAAAAVSARGVDGRNG